MGDGCHRNVCSYNICSLFEFRVIIWSQLYQKSEDSERKNKRKTKTKIMQRKKLEENAERKTKLKMAKKLELNDKENKRKNRKINLAHPVTNLSCQFSIFISSTSNPMYKIQFVPCLVLLLELLAISSGNTNGSMRANATNICQ